MDTDTLAMEHPEVRDIQTAFDKKLYHEVYLEVTDFLRTGTPKNEQCLGYLQDLLMPQQFDRYNAKELGYALHPLEFADICLKISDCKKALNPGSAITFLAKALDFLIQRRKMEQGSREGKEAEIAELYLESELVLKTALATLKFQQGADEAKPILREGANYIATMRAKNRPIDGEVYRQHYYLAMVYYRKSAQSTKYLEVALHYLSHCSLDTLDKKIQMGLARDITYAAIFSEDTFNFGKVLFHPVMKSLEGTNHEPLGQLLAAFDAGDMTAFAKHKNCLGNKLTDSQKSTLEEKMRLMALMVMCWKLPSDKRVVTFKTIQNCCSVSDDRVEFALMKAMSKGLIEGTINQVKERVTITKVQPRDIDQSGVEALIQKVDGWINCVDDIAALYKDF